MSFAWKAGLIVAASSDTSPAPTSTTPWGLHSASPPADPGAGHADFVSVQDSVQDNFGLPECPCIEWAGLDAKIHGDHLIYAPSGPNGPRYNYPPNFGNVKCQHWDLNQPPMCDNPTVPGWCSQRWCYVDAANCPGVSVSRSTFFLDESNLYFSYETCSGSGGANSFSTWLAGAPESAMVNLIGLVDSALRTNREQIESSWASLSANGTSQACQTDPMCPCATCQQHRAWGTKHINFQEVAVDLPTSRGISNGQPANAQFQGQMNQASCLASAIEDPFRRVAASESDARGDRIGYQYYADHLIGSYVQWPAMNWCPRQAEQQVSSTDFGAQNQPASSGWDPRLRPWYATGATGPKDVVIVVDTSGSMAEHGRIAIAVNAVVTVLNTLTWRDFATIILFHHGVNDVYSDSMVAVTDSERANMQLWAEQNIRPGGGTNFEAGMKQAMDLIQQSVDSGATAMCEKAILFLTDGVADFSESAYTNTQQAATRNGVIVFTYALGSGADTSVTKRLACENNGVFYAVPDGGDLPGIMSKYFEYFAFGNEACQPSWVKYTDGAGTGTDLYAGCMAIYDRTGSLPTLLGTSCMDANLVASVDDLRANEHWDEFVCKISDLSKTCRANLLTDCHRERIRASYADSSVCGSVDAVRSGSCMCVSPDCQDDAQFVDEKGYFCDTWVGDVCEVTTLVNQWGYSQAGAQEVLSKCPRSCNQCPWGWNCDHSAPRCPEERQSPPQCRACLGTISGLDVEGQPMTCPGAITAADIALYIFAAIAGILLLVGLAFGVRLMIRKGGQRAKASKDQSAKKAASGSLLDDSDFSVEDDEDADESEKEGLEEGLIEPARRKVEDDEECGFDLKQLQEAETLIRVRYVRLEQPNQEALHVQQVEVYDAEGKNVALKTNGGRASQSSTEDNWIAALAIDGNKDHRAGHPNSQHTNDHGNQWWQLDLGSIFHVKEVCIYNRPDGCQERIEGVCVKFLDASEKEVWPKAVLKNERKRRILFADRAHAETQAQEEEERRKAVA